MAPPNATPGVNGSEKESITKLTPGQATALVRDYLETQNRPFSAIDISANLRGRVSKAATAKICKDLHEAGTIVGCAAAGGKQMVYHALQDREADASHTPEALAALESRTTQLREHTIAAQQEEKLLRARVRKHVETPARYSIEEIQQMIGKLEAEHTMLEERLQRNRRTVSMSGSQRIKAFSVSERMQIERAYVKAQSQLHARQKIRAEMWKEIAGLVGSEGGRPTERLDELREELGLNF